MRYPPSRRSLAALVLCAVLITTALVPAASAANGGTQTDSCSEEYYDPDLELDWDRTYTDPIANGSLSDWTGGRLVQVGPDGGCSLAVLDGESARLNATTINASRGIVIGALDLGTNGTLALSDTGQNETVDDRPVVRISNSGPDFSSTLAVAVGDKSRTVSLSTGRFFEFAIVRDNASTRVTLWAAMDPANKQELTFENATVEGPLELHLDGRAFLSGLTTGFVRVDQSQTDRSNNDNDTSDDDEFDDLTSPSDRYPREERKQEPLFGVGLIFSVIGAGVFYAARPISNFSEKTDAIGSTTPWDEVEAAEWNILLTRAMGAILGLYGLSVIVRSVL